MIKLKIFNLDRWSKRLKQYVLVGIAVGLFLLGVSVYWNVQNYNKFVRGPDTVGEIAGILLEINPAQDPAIVEVIAETIIEACDTYRQDPWLIVAIYREEAACKRWVTNPESGAACGMQLLMNEKEIAARGLKGKHELYHIRNCFFNGVLKLKEKYDACGTTEKALLAYGGFITKDGSWYVADIMCFRYDVLSKHGGGNPADDGIAGR